MKNLSMMTKTRAESSTLVTDGIGTDLIQGTVVGTGAMAAGLIGAWSLSCMVAGVIAAGGPLALVTSWFRAVSGM